MWWLLKKLYENSEEIAYSYGRETRKQSGKLVYNKQKNNISIVQLAENDTKKSAERLLPHFYRIIFDEQCPDERQIAIG